MNKLFIIFTLISLSGILLSNTPDKAELKFSHKYHVLDEEIDCETCHQSAINSEAGSDNLLPLMDACQDCHDIDDENYCVTCHTDVDNPREVPRIDNYSVKFNHKAHIDNSLNCNDCHETVSNKTVVEPFELPNMVFCMECHDQKSASNECMACHTPNESLIPVSHKLDFKHDHSDLANSEDPVFLRDKKCSTCHQTTFCQECHEGENLDKSSHPINYQFTHALEAQGKEMECSACHAERSFCIECHRGNNVLPRNHLSGWVNQIKDDGGRHSIEAETDLESCMACHEQNAEQICSKCHGN